MKKISNITAYCPYCKCCQYLYEEKEDNILVYLCEDCSFIVLKLINEMLIKQ